MRGTRIAVLTRFKELDGNTLSFTTPVLTGRRLLDFIDKERVPDFDGDSATFEIEKGREPGCPWLRWRVLRRVPDETTGSRANGPSRL